MRWQPVHRKPSDRPLPKLGSVLSVKQSVHKSKNKRKSNRKDKPYNKDSEILQYHVSETDPTNLLDNIEILNSEINTHSSGMQFHNMIRAKIGVLQTQCLIDTGASISVIAEHFLDKIPPKFIKKLPNKFTLVHGIGHFQQKINSN